MSAPGRRCEAAKPGAENRKVQTLMKIFVILAAVAAAILVASSSAQARSTGSCAYKMQGFAVWMRFSHTPGSACDAFESSANGSMVRTWTVSGSARCQFEGLGGMVATMYGNNVWGPAACAIMAPKLRAQGWTRVF